MSCLRLRFADALDPPQTRLTRPVLPGLVVTCAALALNSPPHRGSVDDQSQGQFVSAKSVLEYSHRSASPASCLHPQAPVLAMSQPDSQPHACRFPALTMYQRGSTIWENEPINPVALCPLKVFRVALASPRAAHRWPREKVGFIENTAMRHRWGG